MISTQAGGAPFNPMDFISGIINDDSIVSGLIFTATRGYIYGMVRNFGIDGFGSIQRLLLTVLTLYLTIWFIVQGWRIATGQSRDSMLHFSQRAVGVAFVLWLAQLGLNHSENIIDKIEMFQGVITETIAGNKFKNPEKMIDGTLVLMQLMANKMQVHLTDGNRQMMSTALIFVSGIGQAMPAIISGGLLLLNKVALYLCVLFTPLGLVAYLYQSTRFIFVNWLKFTIATLFSLAIITVVCVIAMKAVLFVTAALIAAEMSGGVDLQSVATVQGGVGMLLSTLLVGGPPLVTNFFSGAVNSGTSGFNAMAGFAGGVGGPASSPQDMMMRNNTQQVGGQGQTEKLSDTSQRNLLTGQNTPTLSSDQVRTHSDRANSNTYQPNYALTGTGNYISQPPNNKTTTNTQQQTTIIQTAPNDGVKGQSNRGAKA